MKRVLLVLGVAAIAGSLAVPAHAQFPQLIPGKLFIAKPSGKLVKVLSKPTGPVYVLPSNDPSSVTTTLHVFDVGSGAGDDTYSLNSGTWKGLGSPPGAKGWKYKGAGTGADPCKVVIIKEKIIKAVCKDFASGGGGITLTPPFAGAAGAVLSVDTDQYCAEWGAGSTEIKNDVKLIKRKDAPAPGTCPSVAAPTDTPTPADTGTPTPTSTPVVCPLTAGEYTVTQTAGGTLTVTIFAPFPFPTGGTIVMDTGPPDADCVHDSVIPFPGGFTAPTFCVPALGFTVHVEQTGCGIGQIDSDGGSDYTIDEKGDSSDAACGASQAGAACATYADSSQRVDIKVGDSVTDTCAVGTSGNVIASIPVYTTTWTPAGPPTCPDPDGVYDAGTDSLVTAFPQTLDFTTDTNTASFVDLNGDLCKRGAGFGPDGPFTATGVCLDNGLTTVTTVASGTVASSGTPAGDLLFTTTLPNTFASTGAYAGTVCGSPPILPLPTGMGMRCFVAP
jgi:hypothetical protein